MEKLNFSMKLKCFVVLVNKNKKTKVKKIFNKRIYFVNNLLNHKIIFAIKKYLR